MAASLALVACGKSKEPEPASTPRLDAKPEAPRQAPVVGDAAIAVVPVDAGPVTLAEGEKLTPETLERLHVAVDGCKWDSTGAGLTSCPAVDALYAARQQGNGHVLDDYAAQRELEQRVATKLLTHTSPQVRYRALDTLYYISDADEYAAIADAVEREQHTEARQAMAERIQRSATSHPKLAALILKLADDPDPVIRREIAYGLAHAKGVPGALDKLVAMAKSDADSDTRQHACEAIGKHGDASSLEFYRAILTVETEPYVYDNCLKGLLALWMDTENANEAAYELSLQLIGKGPHRPSAPSVELSNPFRDLPQTMKDAPDDWKAKKWVKVSEIGAAMLGLARSKDADFYARESMVELLPAYGVKKKELVAIRKSLPTPLPESLESLAAKLDETIAAMK